jgi:hypothetical protein
MSITALGLMLAVLGCRNVTARNEVSYRVPQEVQVQRRHTTRRVLPPDSVPSALFKKLGTVSGKPLLPGVYIRDIVIVDFELGATAAERQAALNAVGGIVVGGQRYPENPSHGTYFVRVTGGTPSSLLRAVTILQDLPQVSFAGPWELTPLDLESSRQARKGVDSQKIREPRSAP